MLTKVFHFLVTGGTSLAQVIVDIANDLSARNLPRFGVGIQLVQIGNDAQVSRALESLDNKLAVDNGVRVSFL